jgi:hypothetical protein
VKVVLSLPLVKLFGLLNEVHLTQSSTTGKIDDVDYSYKVDYQYDIDGNGRTARALFYWVALKNNYWLFQYIDRLTQ